MRAYYQACLVFSALRLSFVAALDAASSELARGKALFEKKCNPCHSLERSIDVRDDRAGREQVIRRMIIRGAKLDKSQVDPVLEYMNARATFETKCTVCHELERPLTSTKNPEQWQAIVQYLLLLTAVEPGTPASGQR